MNVKKEWRSSFGFTCFIVCMAGLISLCAPKMLLGAQAISNPTKLRCATHYPPTHTFTLILQQMAKNVARVTEGRVLIEIHHSGTLVKGSDQLIAVEKGTVDMANDVIQYNASSIPVLGAGLIPGIWKDDVTSVIGLRECVPIFEQALKEKGFKNIRVPRMMGNAVGTFLITTDKLVKVPSDLKGLKLRSTGPLLSNVFKKLGAAPMILPTAHTYENLARHLIDGAVSYLGSTVEYKLNEVTKYGTLISLGNAPQWVIMNRQSLDKLAPTDREIVAENAAFAGNEIALSWSVKKERDIAYNKKVMKELYTPTPEEMKLWDEALAPSTDEYIEKAGPLGKKIVEILRKYNAMYPVKY